MSVLIQGGLVVDTEPHPHSLGRVDVLVEDGRIAAVGPDLPRSGPTVLDATGCIVLPGFVDTHRHVWQSVLRGTAIDVGLGEYLERILGRYGTRFRPSDVHAATLAGALECLDGGVTTVQDYSYVQDTHEHREAGVAALREAGVRAVFGYGAPVAGGGARRMRDSLGDGGLITMALAAMGPSYAPMEAVEEDWLLARELDIPVALHVSSGPVARRPVQALQEAGLLNAGTLFVHGNSLPDDELRRIADSGGAVSIAPAVEAQMGHGAPVVNRLRAAGVTTGLGVDVVTAVAGDMFSLMRATLLTSQLGGGERLSAADVLRLATLDGAAALGLADRIGSLRPGKDADLVLLRADALNLVTGLHDPVGAIVTAAHPGNVDTVLVAGRVVKRHGRLDFPGLSGALAAAEDAARHVTADAGA